MNARVAMTWDSKHVDSFSLADDEICSKIAIQYDYYRANILDGGSWAPLPWSTGYFKPSSRETPAAEIYDPVAQHESVYHLRWHIYEQYPQPDRQACIPVILPLIEVKAGGSTDNLPSRLFQSMMHDNFIMATDLYLICVRGELTVALPDFQATPLWSTTTLTSQQLWVDVAPADMNEQIITLQAGQGVRWAIPLSCRWDYHRVTSSSGGLGCYVAFQTPANPTHKSTHYAYLKRLYRAQKRPVDYLAMQYPLSNPPIGSLKDRPTHYNPIGNKAGHLFFKPRKDWAPTKRTHKMPHNYPAEPIPQGYSSSFLLSDNSDSSSLEDEYDQNAPTLRERQPTPLADIIGRNTTPANPPSSSETRVESLFKEGIAFLDQIMKRMQQRLDDCGGLAGKESRQITDALSQFEADYNKYNRAVVDLRELNLASVATANDTLLRMQMDTERLNTEFHEKCTTLFLQAIVDSGQIKDWDDEDFRRIHEDYDVFHHASVPLPSLDGKKRPLSDVTDSPMGKKRKMSSDANHTIYMSYPSLGYFQQSDNKI